MRKNLIFPLLAVLFLSTWAAYAYDNDRALPETVHADVSQPSSVPTWNVHGTSVEAAAVSIESVGSSSQATELKNPTFKEVRDFIIKDLTSRKKFVLNQYECRHFATDVNNNAEDEGLRCAFVLLCYDRGQHAVIAFDTPDRGLIFIEPQTDAAIHPEVGGKYQGKEIKEILIAW